MTPRFKPLHPDFPVALYRAVARVVDADIGCDPYLLDGAAPFAFTSLCGIDAEAPCLGWRALQKIWAAGPRDPRDGDSVCDSCAGPLRVYGFATMLTQAVIARACLRCELTYVESMTRDALLAEVHRWGFKNFTVGLGAGLQGGANAVLTATQSPTAEEARAQLFSQYFVKKAADEQETSSAQQESEGITMPQATAIQVYKRSHGETGIELVDSDIDPKLGILIIDDAGFAVIVAIRDGKIRITNNGHESIAVQPVSVNSVFITKAKE